MTEKNNGAIAEAVLFIAGRFMSLDEMVMYTNINPLTLKEVLPNIRDLPLHGCLPLRMSRHRRVYDEALVLRVLQKRSVEDRLNHVAQGMVNHPVAIRSGGDKAPLGLVDDE